jgi:hypothetical protein
LKLSGHALVEFFFFGLVGFKEAPEGMLLARIRTALGARLNVFHIKDGGEVEVIVALQCARFLESAMSTLLHGPAPT